MITNGWTERIEELEKENERLKKFEKMWREFENKDLTYKSDSPDINDEMYYVEQKYFPEGEK